MNEATILVHQRAFFVVVVDTYNWHSVERLVPRQLHGFDDLPVQLPLLNRFTAVAADVVATYTRRPAARFIIEGTEKRNTHNTQHYRATMRRRSKTQTCGNIMTRCNRSPNGLSDVLHVPLYIYMRMGLAHVKLCIHCICTWHMAASRVRDESIPSVVFYASVRRVSSSFNHSHTHSHTQTTVVCAIAHNQNQQQKNGKQH